MPVLDPWTTDILPRLPADLAAHAHALGAFTRVRNVPSPTALLRALLTAAAHSLSLRQLGCWGVLTDLADLAPSCWLDRLRAAGPWLHWLLGTLLALPQPRWLPQVVRGRVLLIDATCLRWAGGTGADLRLHLALDLLAGQLAQVVLTDQHGGEHVRHCTCHAGDLLVLDAGYGTRSNVAHIQQAQADALVRIYPPTFPLETADGQRLDLRAVLDRCRANQTSRRAYYRVGPQRYAVRVLASRQADPQRHAGQRRARLRARKRQRPLQVLTQYGADWLVLITTLCDPTTWPDHTLWRRYRARWQVELFHKHLKQGLGLGRLRCRTWASAVPLVWAQLVVWVLHAPISAGLRRHLQTIAAPHPRTYPDQHPDAEAVVNGWGLGWMVLSTVRQALLGQWDLARVQACLPRLVRFVVTHPRTDREHHATEVVAWLSGVRRTRQRGPAGDA